MRILHLDIETAPNLVYTWGLWNQTISIEKIVKPSYILCWSAKWHGEKTVHTSSCEDGDQERMIRAIHKLLSEADVVVHYNGDAFDLPRLNQEFVKFGLAPPSPTKSVDLYKVVKKKFDLPSSKLEYVATYFGLGKKVKHPGMEMWIGCLNGDKASWKLMRKYNIGDVELLEKTYVKLLPWIDNHPNHGTFGGESMVCPNCGSKDLQKRGVSRTKTQIYQRYQCVCGKWARGAKRTTPKGLEVLRD